jgi:hypothetical protein
LQPVIPMRNDVAEKPNRKISGGRDPMDEVEEDVDKFTTLSNFGRTHPKELKKSGALQA